MLLRRLEFIRRQSSAFCASRSRWHWHFHCCWPPYCCAPSGTSALLRSAPHSFTQLRKRSGAMLAKNQRRSDDSLAASPQTAGVGARAERPTCGACDSCTRVRARSRLRRNVNHSAGRLRWLLKALVFLSCVMVVGGARWGKARSTTTSVPHRTAEYDAEIPAAFTAMCAMLQSLRSQSLQSGELLQQVFRLTPRAAVAWAAMINTECGSLGLTLARLCALLAVLTIRSNKEWTSPRQSCGATC